VDGRGLGGKVAKQAATRLELSPVDILCQLMASEAAGSLKEVDVLLQIVYTINMVYEWDETRA